MTPTDDPTRELATIMFSDVVGYTAPMVAPGWRATML
jgi:class 3 adenylate cyclase